MYFCGHNRKMFPLMGIKICIIRWSVPKNFTFRNVMKFSLYNSNDQEQKLHKKWTPITLITFEQSKRRLPILFRQQNRLFYRYCEVYQNVASTVSIMLFSKKVDFSNNIQNLVVCMAFMDIHYQYMFQIECRLNWVLCSVRDKV